MWVYRDKELTKLEGHTPNFTVSGDYVIWGSNNSVLNRKNIITDSLEIIEFDNGAAYNFSYPIKALNMKGEVCFYPWDQKDIYLLDSVGIVSKQNSTTNVSGPIISDGNIFYYDLDGDKLIKNDGKEEVLAYDGPLKTFKISNGFIAFTYNDSISNEQIAIIDTLGNVHTVTDFIYDSKLVKLNPFGQTLFYNDGGHFISYENYDYSTYGQLRSTGYDYYWNKNEWKVVIGNSIFNIDTTFNNYHHELNPIQKTIIEDRPLSFNLGEFVGSIGNEAVL